MSRYGNFGTVRSKYPESELSFRRRHRRTRNLFILAFCGVLALGVLAVGTFTVSYAASEDHRICQVDPTLGKDHSTNSSGDSVYRVYTNCGVFSVEDDLFRGRFNSADTYAKLQAGGTYDFHIIGWRNGFFSTFPNILDATPVGHE